VNQDIAAALVLEVAKHFKGKLRIDGNEAWSDLPSYLAFEKVLRENKIKVEFIEQPFKASDVKLYKELFPVSHYPLMADESITESADFEDLKSMFHMINIKLMKTGSFFKAIDFLKAAREQGMQTMLGCMIETSLGISQAMALASLADFFDLDGCLLIKEDPFSLVELREGKLYLKS
jgi:L-alanine-DL-glutamate epimerase-like enolase superfamily enzyme